MTRPFLIISILTLVAFTFSRCSFLLALADTSDECERYSIYRSTLFGDDDLLWEETECDYGVTDLESRCSEKLEYYTNLYSRSYVYKEHVTYNK